MREVQPYAPWHPFVLSLLLLLPVAASSANVAPPIAHLVSVEMIKRLVSTVRMWTSVTVMRIEAVIDVSLEVMWAVKPRAGSDEYTAVKPLRAVVSIWRAIVRREIVVAVRATRFWSDIDRDLRVCRARNAQQNDTQCRKRNKFQKSHKFLLTSGKQLNCQNFN
jgi:hypothetical protein